MKTNTIITLLVIGILLGPCYSVVIYFQAYPPPESSYVNDQLPNLYLGNVIQSIEKPNFIADNNTINSKSSVQSISVNNQSIYFIDQPFQGVQNFSADNFVNKKSCELIEINMSSDFQTILTTKAYLLPNFPIENLTINGQVYPNSSAVSYYRTVFYNSSFWTVSRVVTPYNGLYNVSYNIISYNKQGTILSTHNLEFDNHLFWDISTPAIDFLGLYHNYIFIEDIINQEIDIFSGTNFTRSFTIPFGLLITPDSQFDIQLDGYPVNNINLDSNGYLWFQTNTYYLAAVSLNDLLIHQTSSIKKAVKVNDLFGFWTTPFNLFDYYYPYYLHNGTFHDIPVDVSWKDSSLFATQNNIIYIQYLPLKTPNNDYVLTGVSVNKYSKSSSVTVINNGVTHTSPYIPIYPTSEKPFPTISLFINFVGYTILVWDIYNIISRYDLKKYILRQFR